MARLWSDSLLPLEKEISAADRRSRLVVAAVVAAASLVAFVAMRPDKIFLANTPSGGDMGAHVLIPAYLRDTLLPSGRLLGWSNDWYAGFPMLFFYFPLPALVIVLLDLLLPYGVAFKLVTVAGLVALPPASYYFARSMGFARPVALVGGIAGSTFMFMETFSIFGGNTLSTLAGEYSFSWSFALSLVYLGMVIRNTREGRGFTVGSGVVLALTALCHIITTFVVVIASLPLLLRRKGPSAVVGAWGLGFALAAFWAVPLVARVSYSTDMGWHPVGDLWQVFPRDLWPMMVLGAAGLAWAVSRRMTVGPALTLIVFPLAGFFAIRYADWTKLYNARLLPYWYYAVFLFAGLFVGLALMELVRRMRLRGGSIWVPAALASAVFLVVSAVGIQKTPAWAQWNYTGYEGKPAYAEYRAVLELVDTLPPGRIMWEANNEMNKYGTPMALMLFPYWSEGHPSMEGLLFESSLTTPFHFLNAAEVSLRPSNPVGGLRYHAMDFSRAVPHLALYDVAYYVSYTEEGATAAADYGLELLGETPPFKVFALPESDLVEVAAYQPSVWGGEGSFLEASLTWYDDLGLLDRWMVAQGPEDWPRVQFLRVEKVVKGGPAACSDFSFTLDGGEAIAFDDDCANLLILPVGSTHSVVEVGPVADYEVSYGNCRYVEIVRGQTAVCTITNTYGEVSVPNGSPTIPGDAEGAGQLLSDLPADALGTFSPADGDFQVLGVVVAAVESVAAAEPITTTGVVSDVVLEPHRISFHTTAVGVPHLVKVSYFPNWQAANAEGPYRAAPSLMVVVPTDEDVTLDFRNTWAETGGMALTGAALLGLAGLGVWRLVRRRRAA